MYPARIFFILARKVNKVVIFRRGPTKWTQMLVWNLDGDSLEYGQWSKVKLRPQNCDLSPSGNLLIYLDDRFENGDSCTAISKPPYWQALTKWKHSTPMYGRGGGLFDSGDAIQLNWHSPLETEQSYPVPPHLCITYLHELPEYNMWKGQTNPLLHLRSERDGWMVLQDDAFVKQETQAHTKRNLPDFWATRDTESLQSIVPQLWVKPITKTSFLYKITYYHSDYHKTFHKFYIKRRNNKKELEEIEWADIDHKSRIIATKKGKLYASKSLKDGSIQLDNLELLHDLNAHVPKRISVPEYIKKW